MVNLFEVKDHRYIVFYGKGECCYQKEYVWYC